MKVSVLPFDSEPSQMVGLVAREGAWFDVHLLLLGFGGVEAVLFNFRAERVLLGSVGVILHLKSIAPFNFR